MATLGLTICKDLRLFIFLKAWIWKFVVLKIVNDSFATKNLQYSSIRIMLYLAGKWYS